MQDKALKLDITQLLIEVPALLQHLPPSTLRALCATSTLFRSQIHKLIRTISVRGPAECSLQLVTQHWPAVTKVAFVSPVPPTTMSAFSYGNWSSLCSLDFRGADLNTLSLRHLAASHLPTLQHLYLCSTNLYGSRMAAVGKGNWPMLKTLFLSQCNLNYGSIAHLTAAGWQQLEILGLRCNALTADSVAQLSEGRWPELRQLNLGGVFAQHVQVVNGIISHDSAPVHIPSTDIDFMGYLKAAQWPKLQQLNMYSQRHMTYSNIRHTAQCAWPELQALDLSHVPLDSEACLLLSQSHWPQLQRLILAQTGIDADAMSYLIQAKWPMLEVLNLQLNRMMLRVVSAAALAQANWPQLHRLCLHGNNVSPCYVTQLVKLDWKHLKQLVLSCIGLDVNAVRALLLGRWNALESLWLALNGFTPGMIELLSPGNRANLKLGINRIVDASMINGGQWPKLAMLTFANPAGPPGTVEICR